MFGIGGSEIIVILVVALLFLGPDKLPDAAKTISKGIRDLKKQTRALQTQIESDEHIGGAIRDLKSALRGDPEFPARPPVRREPPKLPATTEATAETAGDAAAASAAATLAATSASSTNADTASPASTDAGVAHAAPTETETAPAVATAPAAPSITLPVAVGESDGEAEVSADELGHLIKPAPGTVAKS